MEISEAIILDVYDYDENDGIVTAFFKDGRIMTIYAQGIQKANSKNRLNLMQFSVVEMEYFQKRDRSKAKLMRSMTLIEPSMKTLYDLNLFAGMSSLIKDRLAAGTKIYDIFHTAIRESQFRTVSIQLILFFLINIFRLENVFFKTDFCAICGVRNNKIISFDSKRGGMICEWERDRHTKILYPEFIEKIRLIFNAKDIKTAEFIYFSLEEYRMLLDNFLSYLEDVLGLSTYTFRKI